MSNKQNLSDLNGYLFGMLERLDNDDLTGKQLDIEIKRANAIVGVAQTTIANAALVLKTETQYANVIEQKKPDLLE